MRNERSIEPASTLLRAAGKDELIRTRRRNHEPVRVGKDVIYVRDQAPLHEGNMRLPGGYSFAAFIENLNSRVFFWPGTASGPISYGIRHFERYETERPVIVRVSSRDLFDANQDVEPELCKYNSGSPRCSFGQKSPRGPNTFVDAPRFDGTPSNVVEVTFRSRIKLPISAQIGSSPSGPWQALLVN